MAIEFTDEELQNRCLTLVVDETPKQTGRIHRMQRECRTLAGLIARDGRRDALYGNHAVADGNRQPPRAREETPDSLWRHFS